MIWFQLVRCGYFLVSSSFVQLIESPCVDKTRRHLLETLSPIIHYLLWQFTLTFWQINQQWALVISCSPDSDWCSFLPLCPWRWRWRCTLSWRPGCRTSGKAWSCCRRRYQTLNHDYWWLTSYLLTLTKALQMDVFLTWYNENSSLPQTDRHISIQTKLEGLEILVDLDGGRLTSSINPHHFFSFSFMFLQR